jgi:hypothetical protein
MSSSKTATRTSRVKEQLVEHDGMLWKPKPGATTTAQEFIHARTTMIAIHKDSVWNPWVREDRADELEHAQRQFGDWTRAEPDFRPMTLAQWKARERRLDAKSKKQHEEEERARSERRALYDREREADRLALLELENGQGRCQREHNGLVDRVLFPAMDDNRRAAKVAECSAQLQQYEAEVAKLRDRVGDPETVIDEHGWLPRERRELAHTMFSIRRQREVKDLREKVRDLTSTLAATKGREPRAQVRDELAKASRRLELWLAIPPIAEQEMCSECCSLSEWHESGTLGDLHGPCPSWPCWSARLQKVRERLLSFSEEKQSDARPLPPKPSPIAVLESGLPIGDVIARLTELQAQYPDAEVRRGRANRWEIWPGPQNSSGV